MTNQSARQSIPHFINGNTEDDSLLPELEYTGFQDMIEIGLINEDSIPTLTDVYEGENY